MNVEELQTAINRWDTPMNLEDLLPHAEDVVLFINAARLVANPNIEAALASVFTKGGAGQPGQEWPVQMYPSDIARAVRAALDSPRDTQCDGSLSMSPLFQQLSPS